MTQMPARKRAAAGPQIALSRGWGRIAWQGWSRRIALLAICPLAPLALGGLGGCCNQPSKAIDRHGPPDVVYELRGGTGRWYWYGDEAPPRVARPDELGFFWLDQGHQVVFKKGCQTYDGPVRTEDWRQFEQARIEQGGVEERLEQTDRP